MSTIDITFHKGSDDDKTTQLSLSPDTKLEEVRKQLEEAKFITHDQGDVQYRFVQTKTKSKTDFDQKQGLIDPENEDQLTLQKVLRRDNDGNYQVALTNAKAKMPDYMGMGTDSFVRGTLRVFVELNQHGEAMKENERIKAYPPMTLTDVRPASGASSNFDNVCVVVEGSLISFRITAWAAAGYEYSIETGMGDMVSDMYAIKGNSGGYTTVDVSAYDKDEKMIKVVGESDKQILDSDRIRIQKIVIKARRVLKYTAHDGTQYANDDHAPSNQPEVSLAFAEYAGSEGDRRVYIVPRNGVKPGTVVPADQTDHTEHETIYAVETESWEEASSVTVYFFVFKTWEEAKKIIGSYNAPPA